MSQVVGLIELEPADSCPADFCDVAADLPDGETIDALFTRLAGGEIEWFDSAAQSDGPSARLPRVANPRTVTANRGFISDFSAAAEPPHTAELTANLEVMTAQLQQETLQLLRRLAGIS